MELIKTPCKGCEFRWVEEDTCDRCHNYCKVYKDFKDKIKALSEYNKKLSINSYPTTTRQLSRGERRIKLYNKK